MTVQIFKIIWGNLPKIEQVSEKAASGRTLELLALYEYCRYGASTSAVFMRIMRASLQNYYTHRESKSIKSGSLNFKTSNIHYFASPIGTVQPY
jgi:hypothetical protein